MGEISGGMDEFGGFSIGPEVRQSAGCEIRPLTMDDYAAAVALWRASEGVGLSAADEPDRIAAYLARNPGMSLAAVTPAGELVAAALCGHDGRRGFLHHVAVRSDYRGRGLGRELVSRCLDALRAAGIDKCHLFVFGENRTGRAFWESTGWEERRQLVIYSKNLD